MATSNAARLVKYQTRLDTVEDEIEALISTSAGGKPNAPGKNVDHQGYLKRLEEHVDWLQKQIAKLQGPVRTERVGRI